MKAKTPHWPLDRVKALVAVDAIWVQRGRALEFFDKLEDAIASVKVVVAALTTRSLSGSAVLTYDTCDVYGVIVEGAGWYLKICIDEAVPEVVIVSFHPLERPIRTNGGMVKP